MFPDGIGRGVAPGNAPLKTKVPLLPALSRQVPPKEDRLRVASVGTGVPPGRTVVMPNPTSPKGVRYAMSAALPGWLPSPQAVISAIEHIDGAMLGHVDRNQVAKGLQLPAVRSQDWA